MPGVTVSIIICTRNRAESLRQTLRAVAACAAPAGMSVELLVIDNGSTDHTRDIVFQATVPSMAVRYVSEPEAGLSRARNRGLAESLGDVLLFTDDDVRPPRNWIEEMARPILDGTADAVAGGAHLPPSYEAIVNRPPYQARRGWFACTDYIDPARPARMVGANMAFSRRVANAVGHFDPALGAGALGFCEENLFCWQLQEAGFSLIARLDVSVEHHFDLERIHAHALLGIAERLGRSEAYVAHHWDQQLAPPLWQVMRAELGLRVRRLLRLDRFQSKQAREWELIRVERTTLVTARYALRGEPRKYQRPFVPPAARVDVSIIIATRNRARALAETLESLRAATVPEAWVAEVILIDNGSTDSTRDVIARFHPAHLRVRRMTEAVGGKSRALNAAIARAKGEVLLFTDDDVRVPANWIGRMCEPIRHGECDAAVGGIIAGPGRDTQEMFLTPALFDPSAPVAPTILIGANMALHRRVLEGVGGFDIKLGPGAIGMGEDTELSFRAEKAGFRIAPVKDAQVEHCFDLGRCGADEQRKTARQLARAGAYMDYHLHRTKPATTWLSALKSWGWLVRLRLRRARHGDTLHPLTGWELHQLGEVAYRGEHLKQRLHSQPKGSQARGLTYRAL